MLSDAFGPQLVYQIALNGSRIGFYEPLRRNINKAFGKDPNEVLAFSAFGAGAISGVIGGKSGLVVCKTDTDALDNSSLRRQSPIPHQGPDAGILTCSTRWYAVQLPKWVRCFADCVQGT